MLFNPKWNAPSLDGFIGFLDSKPKKGKYDHDDFDHCAIGQYCRTVGKSYDTLHYHLGINWERNIAMPRPHTFGAAAQRAKAYRIDLAAVAVAT